MLHGDPSPLKFHPFPTFRGSGDLGTPRKRPQMAGDSIGDSGTFLPFPKRTPKNRGLFGDFPEVPRPIGDSHASPFWHIKKNYKIIKKQKIKILKFTN